MVVRAAKTRILIGPKNGFRMLDLKPVECILPFCLAVSMLQGVAVLRVNVSHKATNSKLRVFLRAKTLGRHPCSKLGIHSSMCPIRKEAS